MSNNILIISNVSDGIHGTCTRARAVRDDEPLKRYLAKELQSTYNASGLNPVNLSFGTINMLPLGYSAYQAPRQDGSRTSGDIYVAGHPSTNLFLSKTAFRDHFCHLQWYGLARGCPCCLCSKSPRGKGEGLRTTVPNSIPPLQVINSAQAPATALPTPAFQTATASATVPAVPALAFAPSLSTPAVPPAATFGQAMAQAQQVAAQSFHAPLPVQTAPKPVYPPQPAATANAASTGPKRTFLDAFPDEESTDTMPRPQPDAPEAPERFELISPHDDIEVIKKHARIVLDEADMGDADGWTVEDLMEIDWDHFFDSSFPSNDIFEAFGIGAKPEIARILYARLREHEQANQD